MTDVEIIDRINSASKANHDETVLFLTKILKKVDKLEGFKNRVLGMAVASSVFVSIAWTVISHIVPLPHAVMEMGK